MVYFNKNCYRYLTYKSSNETYQRTNTRNPGSTVSEK